MTKKNTNTPSDNDAKLSLIAEIMGGYPKKKSNEWLGTRFDRLYSLPIKQLEIIIELRKK